MHDVVDNFVKWKYRNFQVRNPKQLLCTIFITWRLDHFHEKCKNALPYHHIVLVLRIVLFEIDPPRIGEVFTWSSSFRTHNEPVDTDLQARESWHRRQLIARGPKIRPWWTNHWKNQGSCLHGSGTKGSWVSCRNRDFKKYCPQFFDSTFGYEKIECALGPKNLKRFRLMPKCGLLSRKSGIHGRWQKFPFYSHDWRGDLVSQKCTRNKGEIEAIA